MQENERVLKYIHRMGNQLPVWECRLAAEAKICKTKFTSSYSQPY